jgi:uncharacterized protein
MSDSEIRLLSAADQPRLEAFLQRYADSSLFLRFYLSKGGIIDRGEPLQGTYAVRVANGEITGVAMHSWQNVIFLQAPDDSAEIVRVAVKKTGRPILALVGPWSQVEAARIGLGLSERPLRKRSREDMFALNVSDLVPAPMASRDVECRKAESRDLDLLREWRFRYEIESTGLADTEETRALAAKAIEGHIEREEAFVLEANHMLVSMCAFNARVPDTVQIGGVWTPPALRGRGYARMVVAGALQEAEQQGIGRAVLYTEEENIAARRAYEAIGFMRIGDYGVVVFEG